MDFASAALVRAIKTAGVVVLVLLVALATFLFFGLDTLRGPVSRVVTQSTGRELRIEGRLMPVWSWVHPRFRAERITYANPKWAVRPTMLTAQAVEFSVELLPLFAGRVVVPEVRVEHGRLDLERDASGRKNWVLDANPRRKRSRFYFNRLVLDRGQLTWIDAVKQLELHADLASEPTGIAFTARGRFHGLDASAEGHTGAFISLRGDGAPSPVKGQATIGDTTIDFDGRMQKIIGLQGIDARIHVRGKSMDQLYDIIHVAFPATRPYVTSGRLLRNGPVVRYENFSGKVGDSDLAGTVEVDTSDKPPSMKGELRSTLLKLSDLGPVVGARRRKTGVLPDMPFEPGHWGSVNAQVHLHAERIERPKELPIEQLDAHIGLRERVLTLDPLEFGVAGGTLTGPVTLDGRSGVIRARLDMRVQDLKLAKLFPTIKKSSDSSGALAGLIELDGTGNSVDRMLATSNGKIGLFMDGGEISRFVMELAALDLWHAAKVKIEGDRPIPVKCAIADFAVQDGLMKTNALVFDTGIVNVEGGGVVNLKNERVNLMLKPKPKQATLASFSSPIYVQGAFDAPKVSADVGKIAAQGVSAALLGIINPLLAVLPLMKAGNAKDSNCGALIAQATTK